MLLGSRQKLQRLDNCVLKIVVNNIELDSVTHTKCLGVIIDNTLSLKFHVDSVVKSMQQKLGMIRSVKFKCLWSTIKHLSCNTNDSSIKLHVNGTDVASNAMQEVHQWTVDNKLIFMDINGQLTIN